MKQFKRQILVFFFSAMVLVLPTAVQSQPKKRPVPQKTQLTAAKKKPAPKTPTAVAAEEAKPTPDIITSEKERFDAAISAATPSEKAELLVRFISDFPRSENKLRAQESLAGARAAMADERLSSGDTEQAIRLFRLAVEQAPKPYGDRLFNEIIAAIPANLYWRGHPQAGLELAHLIESAVAGNAKQLMVLSTFYLGTENGGEAKRLAEAAIKLDETNAAAHQALATAHRLNFELEEAAASFAKALELDPGSVMAKRSLADMKRALGKPDEAEALYRELLELDEKDNLARTGLILSLFDRGRRENAETEMARSLEQVPGNVVLLAGAAYWYAANNDGEKAVEFARRAINTEPRYIWSHIALGRGLILQNKPVEAEQVLISARKYGNFPTLQYEIASARLAAGFFQEAAEELKKSFVLADGKVATRLGGRIERSGETLSDVLSFERKASIFAPAAADSPESSARLKALLELDEKLRTPNDETEIAAAADRFADGADNMAVHRKLFAASRLLEKNIAADKAFELAQAATVNLDASLDVANPGAAVMASQLYEARNVSFAQDNFLLIPDVPRQTLSALMRGRVEEITGIALMKQGKPEDAAVRFRRALTVFPKDSAWWRSATWNLGTSLQASGKEQEALDTLISSYKIDKPDIAKYLIIESLYRKVNGTIDGLEEKVGPSPMPTFTAATEPKAAEAAPADLEKPADDPAVSPDARIAEPEPKKAENPPDAVIEKRPFPSTLPISAEIKPDKPADEKPKAEPDPPAPEISPSPSTGAEPKRDDESPKEMTERPAVPSEPEEAKPATSKEPEKDKGADLRRSEPKADIKTVSSETETKLTPVSATTTGEPTNAEPEASTSERPEQKELPKAQGTPEAGKDEPAASPAPEAVEPAKPEPKKLDEDIKQAEEEAPKTAVRERSIFDPIVISVPKRANTTNTTKPAEELVLPESEAKAEENNPEPEVKKERPAASVIITDGLSRPRVITGKPITEESDSCTIGVSQENFSVLNNGGSVAVLVSIDLGRKASSITAVSSSPDDIEVRTEPDVVAVAWRSLYVIKSVSRKAGNYRVTFTAPCGEKEVSVRVR